MSDLFDSGRNGNRTSMRGRIKRHFENDITRSWTDATLMLCCFKTGLLDAAVFNVWSCFVSMQTGNTLYVGLGVTGQPKDQPYRWIKSGTAILAFVVGCYIFSRLQRSIGSSPRSRISLVTTTVAQLILTAISAMLSTSRIVPIQAGHMLPHNLIVLIPLCLLSLQSAAQIVMSRLLGFPELTTVVLTSAYADLAIDEKLFEDGVGGNSTRNRRLLSIVVMLGGATLGGYLTLDGDIEYALWLATGIKVLVLVAWMAWKADTGSIRIQ